MITKEIKKLFNEFRAEYDFEKHEQVWKRQSKEFRRFWNEKILNDDYPELSKIDMDYVIRFFDAKATGAKEFRENGGEHAANAGIRPKMWHRALKDLKNKQDIKKIVNQIFIAKNNNSKIDIINKLEKVNEKNGLTGRNAVILNALLCVYDPNKYLTMLSTMSHRLPFIDFFEFGDSKQYRTYGEQVINTNRDIISGFKEKYGIDITPNALSNFIYGQLDKFYHWRKKALCKRLKHKLEYKKKSI